MFNLITAITATLFWYTTGEVLPALLGGMLAVIIREELFFLVVMLSVAVIGLCSYYFWFDIILNYNGNPSETVKLMGVTVIYMFSTLLKAVESFR